MDAIIMDGTEDRVCFELSIGNCLLMMLTGEGKQYCVLHVLRFHE